MWKIFTNQTLTSIETFQAVNDWKSIVFQKTDFKLKKYFAEKVAVYFDNAMLLKKSQGLHDNLLEALSLAEKEIQNLYSIFPDIKCLVMPEDYNSVLITVNLPNDNTYYPKDYGFNLFTDNAEPNATKIARLKNQSWENLIFSIEISDFARGWINHTPSLEERTELQVKHILLSKNFQNKNLTLLEKVKYEEDIKKHFQYNELYNKIIKIMPKIETTLEEEWKDSLSAGDLPVISVKKKGIK